MQVVKRYPDGVVSWVDLATSDPEGAKVFYSGLFGWEFEDIPTGQGMMYSMGRLKGHTVAGLGPQDPEMMAQGVPPVWSSYVNHSDVDAVATRATAAGGTVLFPPMDVMSSGRMTMIADPTGAIIGVWQPNEHIGAELVNIPNTLTWNELQTRDVSAARDFYAAVFDWQYDVDENGYVSCKVSDRVQAGMMAIQESWGDVPPNWATYFLVEDVAQARTRAIELGGTALTDVMPAGEMGRFVLVADPQGGQFTLIEYAGPADPPPGHE